MQSVIIKGIEIAANDGENYIQINDIGIKETEEIWDELAKNYAGCTADFCFHNTVAPEAFLKEKGAALLDNCIEAWLSPKEFAEPAAESLDIIEINQSNFHLLSSVHDEKNPDMHWNSERLLKDLSNWYILLMLSDGEVQGYILMRSGWEIYCLQAEKLENKIALMASCVRKAFSEGDKEVLFMIDRNNYLELGAALHLGFKRKGYYISYRMKF